MIPALIFWLIKKHLLHVDKNRKRQEKSTNNRKKIATHVMLLLLFYTPVIAQHQVYRYNVIYNRSNIGLMQITQIKNGDELTVQTISNIRMRMLMSLNIKVAEESSYKQDKLINSSVYREVNGKPKANRLTKLDGEGYQTTSEGKAGMLNKTVITYNLAKLYCEEPVNISQVYSDNFQQFVTLKDIGNHSYKLQLPGGNYNIYYYQNGICNKVDVNSTFYTIQMQLAE